MSVTRIPIWNIPLFITMILIVTAWGAQGETDQVPSIHKAGFAEVDITPALGMEIPGGYGKAFHQKFHDPCKVRAVVFDDGEKRVALVGVDALMVPRTLVEDARKAIQEQCGIPPQAVLIGASHSHSSGPVGMVQPGQFDWASPSIQELAYEKSSCADAAYLDRVCAAVADAVRTANANRAAVRCGFGKGIEDKAAFNRRFRMKNGLTYTHPGKGNPDIESVAGPIDPEVGVIGVWDMEDRFLGCVVNYACHATTSPDGVSANWIYYLERTIRGCFGENAVVVFLQGFSGDVTQVDNLSPSANPPGDEWAQYVGGRVGAEALKVLFGMVKTDRFVLDMKSELVPFYHRIPDPERVKRCLELVQKKPDDVDATEWTFAKEIVLLDALLSQKQKTDVEIQAIQIGPAVFLTAPGEMFCQLGLDIKQKSSFPLTFPVELANGCVGYVPTLEALGERGGGYETRLTSYSNLEPNAGPKMVETALKLAGGMRPSEIPAPAAAPEFRSPWSYGNVPPELK